MSFDDNVMAAASKQLGDVPVIKAVVKALLNSLDVKWKQFEQYLLSRACLWDSRFHIINPTFTCENSVWY